MTVTGGGAGDDPTLPDHEAHRFPSVGDSATGGSPAPRDPLFSRPDGGAEPQATVDVQPVGPPTGPAGRLRWLVAGLATLLVVVLVGGVLVLARPQNGSPSVAAHYVPGDAAMYFEADLSLPGDQRDRLASFMSHFPGFADRAAFDTKLDETIQRLVSSKAEGLDWATDVEPWFGGQLAFFGTQPSAASSAADEQLAVVATVKDRAQLEAVIDAKLAGTQPVQEDYNGHSLWTVSELLDEAGPHDAMTYSITDEVVVAGTTTAVKAALDAFDGRRASLAVNDFYIQQLGRLHADRLATVYASVSAASLPEVDGLGGIEDMDDLIPAACRDFMGSAASTRYVGELRAEDDHMALTTRIAWPSEGGLPMPANRESGLAARMPAGTGLYFEVRNSGAIIGRLIDSLVSCMPQTPGDEAGPDPAAMFEQLLGVAPHDYFDFLGDAALGVTLGDEPGAGLVATVDDEAVAKQRLDRLMGLARMGGSMGEGLSVDEIDHNGVKVTVISLGGFGDELPAGKVELAVSDGRVYLGVGDFVTDALDRSADASLAASQNFQHALANGGAQNAGVFYVDVAGLRTALEANMSDAERAHYEQETRPFIMPLTTLGSVMHADGDILVSDTYLYVE